jgi:DNA-binding MarR family transcriptional regulator
MKTAYIDLLQRIERLHRQFLDNLNVALDQAGIRDLTPPQAMILFHMGDAELLVGELTQRGCYLGSNVSYNVRKLVGAGYLQQQRCTVDRRATRLSATEQGARVRALVGRTFAAQSEELGEDGLDMASLADTLRSLEGFLVRERALARHAPARWPRVA